MGLSNSIPDSILKPGVCLSNTRPPTPYVGQTIFETDTQRMMYWNGTGWVILDEPIQDYVPTLTNIVPGTGGSVVGKYQRGEGYCSTSIVIVLGTSGFSVSGSLTVGIPFAYASGNEFENLPALFFDSSDGARVVAFCNAQTTTSFTMNPLRSDLSYAQTVGMGSTVPFTWATSDTVAVSVRYRMANKHSF